ncbi:MAG TPA: response regulator [Caulobacteraceae bacterium]|jgi:CheY-like chemotaxis protein
MSALSSLNVLLVDDNRHMRTIAATILSTVGVRNLHQAADGAAAIEALTTFPADIAIVDFKMSPMNGVEFTRLVRAGHGGANPFLPVIMMTGHADRHRVAAARDAGVTEFIVKPMTAQAVLSRVQAVIFKQRPFVKGEAYFGPCRRRLGAGGPPGMGRRASDPGQALDLG